MRLIIFCCGILFTSNVLGQIPNGDFAQWAIDTMGRTIPLFWNSDNDMYTRETVIQDTDRLAGAGYSSKFISVYDSSAGYYNGGHIYCTNQSNPGSGQPPSISGFYKLIDQTNQGGFAIDITVYNSIHTAIGSGNWGTNLGTVPNWTSFSLPITYLNADTIASYEMDILFFNLSSDSTIYGNLDDLNFDLSTSVINLPKKDPWMLKQDNGNYILQFTDNIQGEAGIDIIDSKGSIAKHILKTDSITKDTEIDLDLSGLAPGIYYGSIRTKEIGRVFKLVKE